MSHYESDGSTLVNEEHRSRRGRRPAYRKYRSYSSDGRSTRRSYVGDETDQDEDKKRRAKYERMGKVAIVVGLLVGGVYELWQKEKRDRDARLEKEYRRRRRRDFERAKAARRREEESRDRKQESEDEYSPLPETRRIAYRSSSVRSRSTSRSPRRLEPPPPRSGRSSRRTSRARSVGEAGIESDGRGISKTR